MVDFNDFRVRVETSIYQIVSAAASSSATSPEHTARVFSEIVVSVLQEYDRLSNS